MFYYSNELTAGTAEVAVLMGEYRFSPLVSEIIIHQYKDVLNVTTYSSCFVPTKAGTNVQNCGEFIQFRCNTVCFR
jgi:hypothetical protein